MVLSDIKLSNTLGTWDGNAYTYNGITFTVLTDTSDNVIGINVAGTASSQSTFYLSSATSASGHLPIDIAKHYKLYDSASLVRIWVYDSSDNYLQVVGSSPNGTNIAVSDTVSYTPHIRISNETSVNATSYPMICLSTESSIFVPYSNICPISGWTGAEIIGAGKNLFDPQTFADYGGVLQADGSYYFASPNNLYMKHLWDNVNGYDGQLALTWIKKDDTTATRVTAYPVVYYTDGTHESVPVSLSTQGFSTATFVTSANKVVDYITCSYGTNKPGWYKWQIELGSTATEYEPYTGNTISVTFPETIYGGEDEVVSGKLKKTMGMVVFDGSEPATDFSFATGASNNRITWNGFSSEGKIGSMRFISDRLKPLNTYTARPQEWQVSNSDPTVARCFIGVPFTITSVADWQIYLREHPITLIYELAEPVEYTLDGEELTTLYGTNNIWANTGDVTVTYIAKSAKFSFGSPLRIYNYNNLKLFGNTYIEHGKG